MNIVNTIFINYIESDKQMIGIGSSSEDESDTEQDYRDNESSEQCKIQQNVFNNI